MGYTVRHSVKFVGALLYAVAASYLLLFVFASFARIAKSWEWSQVLLYTMLAIATLYVIRITIARYVVNAPLDYLCDNKTTKVLPIVGLAYCAIVAVTFIWKMFVGYGSTYKAVLLNIPVVLYYGALIISYIVANPPPKVVLIRKDTGEVYTYEKGEYITLMDETNKMMRRVRILKKNRQGHLFVEDVMFGWKQWFTPQQLAEMDIRNE